MTRPDKVQQKERDCRSGVVDNYGIDHHSSMLLYMAAYWKARETAWSKPSS